MEAPSMAKVNLSVEVHHEAGPASIYGDIASIGTGHLAGDLVLVPTACLEAGSKEKPIEIKPSEWRFLTVRKVLGLWLFAGLTLGACADHPASPSATPSGLGASGGRILAANQGACVNQQPPGKGDPGWGGVVFSS